MEYPENLKYVVFKREDWDNMSWAFRDAAPEEVPDATVIRGQDQFAAGALHTYSNQILCVIEAMKELGCEPPDNLGALADYFHEQAMRAESAPIKKLPD